MTQNNHSSKTIASISASKSPLSPIEDILADCRKGKPVILVDDEDRENEGDLIVPAELVNSYAINFMAKEGRGLICLSLEKQMAQRLGLKIAASGERDSFKTAFTESIEAREGVTTGISAADRAKTIQVAIDPSSGPQDIVSPGHVFPLMAQKGGVLERAGHTEAGVDLARLSGFSGAAVICEIMKDDGTMARLDDLTEFAQNHDLKIGTIADLIAYRMKREMLVERVSVQRAYKQVNGQDFDLYIYRDAVHGIEHMAFVKGNIKADKAVICRVDQIDETQLLLDKKNRVSEAFDLLSKEDTAVFLCMRGQSVQPSDFVNQVTPIRAPESMIKQYGIGAQILRDLGIHDMVLLTRSEKSLIALQGFELNITEQKVF